MDDGLTEVQTLLHPQSLNQEDGFKREYNKEKEDEFVVSINEVEKVKEVEEDLNKKGGVDSDGGGGLFNNLISSLITPSSPRIDEKVSEHENGNGEFKLEEVGVASRGDHGEKRRGENSGEIGLISNLVSNFFYQSGGEEDVVENEKEKEEDEVIVEKIKRVKTEKETNGSGGIINSIVSHLPPSLPDEAAPTADEATILINSVVRD